MWCLALRDVDASALVEDVDEILVVECHVGIGKLPALGRVAKGFACPVSLKVAQEEVVAGG